ncbi:hypothetical protein L195_g043736 [Trifolium pratense]|uniref:Uncharacterized protein n=2 Tax=Trifolium pratense TaxID=57577 RepID=A0A2K3MA50_TRIPR|nr:hypothetical protein L195_g043736 [Trifolium pratense]CAJ2653803.1 unnamed protein product [Trifolium pratense]
MNWFMSAFTLSCLTVPRVDSLLSDDFNSPLPSPVPEIDVSFNINWTLKIMLPMGAVATTLAFIGWIVYKKLIRASGDVEAEIEMDEN